MTTAQVKDTSTQTTNTEVDDQAAFEAAYSGDETPPVVTDDTGSDTGANVDDTPAAQPQEPSATDQTAAPAAKTDTPAATTTEPDRFEAMEKRMQTWMREMGGVVGGMKDQVARMSAAAKATAHNQGALAPTNEEIQAAAASDEEWAKLEEKYGEWMQDFKKQFGAMEQRLLKKVPAVDTGAITNEVLNKSKEFAQSVGAEVKKVIPLYVKHPDWEDTIKTPDFLGWAYSNGPTEEERKQKWALEASDPQKASEFVNELIRKYPQWWAERGALMDSDSPTDAIKLMDSFTEHQKAAQAAANTPPADKGRQTKRLESAIAPTTGATRVKQVKSDQQEFEEAYNS